MSVIIINSQLVYSMHFTQTLMHRYVVHVSATVLL